LYKNNKNALSILFQNVDTEHYILELNKDLSTIEESLIQFWDSNRIHYAFGGISYLMSYILIKNFSLSPIKLFTPLGIKCIHRNLHSLQQTLCNSILSPISTKKSSGGLNGKQSQNDTSYHALSLVTPFPQYYHHHPQYNDLQFARVKEYTELMKCTLNTLPTQAQQRLFKFSNADFSVLVEIITNNQQEKAKHQKAFKAQRQLLLSSEQAKKWTSLGLQQEKQREVLKQYEKVIKSSQLSLQQEQQDREQADLLRAKEQRQAGRDAKKSAAAAVAAAAVADEGQVVTLSSSDSDSDDDKPPPTGSPLVDLSRWTTIDKDVKIERKKGPAGQTTISTTKRTIIKTGMGDAPNAEQAGGVQIGVGSGINNTTAVLLTKNQGTTSGTKQQHEIVVNTSAATPTNASSPSSRFGFFDRFRKK
jgi:hypothetical protein